MKFARLLLTLLCATAHAQIVPNQPTAAIHNRAEWSGVNGKGEVVAQVVGDADDIL